MNDLNNIVVTDVLNAITVFSPKGKNNTMHNRNSYGLSFCLEGQITYTQNGKKYVSDKNHAVILGGIAAVLKAVCDNPYELLLI